MSRPVPLPDPAFWSGRRVLLTGHTGFKGAWLAAWLRRLGAEVMGVSLPDSPPTPRLWDAIADRVQVASVDADLATAGWEESVRAFGPSVVLHLAAQSLVPTGYREPLRTFASNVMGTARLVDLAADLPGVEVVLVITTDKVYDPRQPAPHGESDYLGGVDPYAASKAAVELVVSSWPAGSARLATARAGNVIGGWDWSDDRLIPDLVRAWTRGESARLRMPDAVRPWQHVLQPLHGYLRYVEALATGTELPVALNFGPDAGQAVTVRELADHSAETWRRLTGLVPEPAVTAEPTPSMVETKHLEISSDLATQSLNWRNLLDWREAAEWTFEGYAAAPDQTGSVLQRQLDRYEQKARG